MRQVWAARNRSGKIIFIGSVTEDACRTLETEIGDFESLDKLREHPEVYSMEVAQPISESVTIAETEIEGGVLLSRSEHIIFSTLSKEVGKNVPRDVLRKALQNFGNADPGRLTHVISRLRQKLKKIGYSISSEYGEGYTLWK